MSGKCRLAAAVASATMNMAASYTETTFSSVPSARQVPARYVRGGRASAATPPLLPLTYRGSGRRWLSGERPFAGHFGVEQVAPGRRRQLEQPAQECLPHVLGQGAIAASASGGVESVKSRRPNCSRSLTGW